METDGEGGGGGGEAEGRGRIELGRLPDATESSEVLEKRIPLIRQLEEFSADDLGLILQGILDRFHMFRCVTLAHCTRHKSIMQLALKYSDLDRTDYLGQFPTLDGKINSLSLSISTKLLGIEANCFTGLGFEVAAGEGWQGMAQEECVLNKTDYAFLTLETMATEVELVPTHQAVGMRQGAMTKWNLTPVLSPPPQEVSRRCTYCASERTSKWLQGPDGPGTLCNACGQRFKKGRLLRSNSRRRLSSIDNSAFGNEVAAPVEALPCGVATSLDAFFDQTVSEVAWEEAGPARAEEEELEWLSNKDAFPSVSWEEAGPELAEEEELEWLFSNKDAFPSVETMALEVEVEEAWGALDAPLARTKGRRRVKAMETTCRQDDVLPVASSVLPQRRRRQRPRPPCCTHCATENTPGWREGPEGPRTLCNACGMVFRKKGRLIPEYRPVNSPSFSPHLHSHIYSRALEMHRQNEITSACHGEVHTVPMEGQLLPPANGPTSSSSPISLVLSEDAFAVIRATAEAKRAERAAAFLTAMDN